MDLLFSIFVCVLMLFYFLSYGKQLWLCLTLASIIYDKVSGLFVECSYLISKRRVLLDNTKLCESPCLLFLVNTVY